MCLSIPAKILSIEGKTARASVGGTVINVGLHMIDDIKEGDYVLVHTGFALQKISDDEAQETLKLIKEMENIGKEQDKNET
jgi:hydrogenase expression/formation protein HypC